MGSVRLLPKDRSPSLSRMPQATCLAHLAKVLPLRNREQNIGPLTRSGTRDWPCIFFLPAASTSRWHRWDRTGQPGPPGTGPASVVGAPRWGFVLRTSHRTNLSLWLLSKPGKDTFSLFPSTVGSSAVEIRTKFWKQEGLLWILCSWTKSATISKGIGSTISYNLPAENWEEKCSIEAVFYFFAFCFSNIEEYFITLGREVFSKQDPENTNHKGKDG